MFLSEIEAEIYKNGKITRKQVIFKNKIRRNPECEAVLFDFFQCKTATFFNHQIFYTPKLPKSM